MKQKKRIEGRISVLTKQGEECGDFEICIFCRCETDVPKTRNITERDFYVEGAGQLCGRCYHDIYFGKRR